MQLPASSDGHPMGSVKSDTRSCPYVRIRTLCCQAQMTATFIEASLVYICICLCRRYRGKSHAYATHFVYTWYDDLNVKHSTAIQLLLRMYLAKVALDIDCYKLISYFIAEQSSSNSLLFIVVLPIVMKLACILASHANVSDQG